MWYQHETHHVGPGDWTQVFRLGGKSPLRTEPFVLTAFSWPLFHTTTSNFFSDYVFCCCYLGVGWGVQGLCVACVADVKLLWRAQWFICVCFLINVIRGFYFFKTLIIFLFSVYSCEDIFVTACWVCRSEGNLWVGSYVTSWGNWTKIILLGWNFHPLNHFAGSFSVLWGILCTPGQPWPQLAAKVGLQALCSCL